MFFQRAAAPPFARALNADGRRSGYAQDYAESLLFFFRCSNPMVVPVDSRQHCTLSPSTQARRAAMAKKRKAKAKAAKKTKRKKK